jgi:nanoRNase/pAp phosphatase (c-di-AMP/oligoRNAs hydrolase)
MLIKTGLERTGIKVSGIAYSTYMDLRKTAHGLKYDKLIIADIGMNTEFCKSIGKPTLIIDHHTIKGCAENKKVTFINPRLVNPDAYQPAAYIVYKLFSGIADISDKEWIAVLGIVGDYAFEDCMDLLSKWTDAKTREELAADTEIGKAASVISGAIFEIGFDRVMKIILSSNSMDEVTKNCEVREASEKYQTLYEKEVENFWKNSEKIGNVIFSVIKPIHEGMGSSIVNLVSRKNPDKIIILFEDIEDKYDIDARHQGDGVHLGNLMEKLCGGGGHKNAAGGLISKGELKEFKKKLLKELKIL